MVKLKYQSNKINKIKSMPINLGEVFFLSTWLALIDFTPAFMRHILFLLSIQLH